MPVICTKQRKSRYKFEPFVRCLSWFASECLSDPVFGVVYYLVEKVRRAVAITTPSG